VPVNGRSFSFEDIEVAKLGDTLKPITGFKSIKWSVTRDVATADDSASIPGEWTRGTYRGGEGSIMLTRKEFDAKIATEDGWMEEIFNFKINYANSGATTEVELIECTITGDGEDAEKGPEGIYVELPFKFRLHRRNGVNPVSGTLEI